MGSTTTSTPLRARYQEWQSQWSGLRPKVALPLLFCFFLLDVSFRSTWSKGVSSNLQSQVQHINNTWFHSLEDDLLLKDFYPPLPPADDDEYIAICMSNRNGHLDLPEFLTHHYYHMGIRKFYIMDDGSDPPLSQLVANYGIPPSSLVFQRISEDDKIIGPLPQLMMYDYCHRLFGMNHEWLGFLDVDEFLEMTDPDLTLKSYLKEAARNETIGAVAANWQVHVADGQLKRQPSNRKAYKNCLADPDLNPVRVVVEEEDDGIDDGVDEVYEGDTDESNVEGGDEATKEETAGSVDEVVKEAAGGETAEGVDAVVNKAAGGKKAGGVAEIVDKATNKTVKADHTVRRRQDEDVEADNKSNGEEDDKSNVEADEESEQGDRLEENKLVRSFVRTSAYQRALAGHTFATKGGTITVDERGQMVSTLERKGELTRNIWTVHHYALKSKEEYEASMLMGHINGVEKDWGYWDWLEFAAHVECSSLVSYVP
jgi:Glycosyl transferase family 2